MYSVWLFHVHCAYYSFDDTVIRLTLLIRKECFIIHQIHFLLISRLRLTIPGMNQPPYFIDIRNRHIYLVMKRRIH